MGTCSPYLLRQIDVIQPKVIVCFGAVAAKTLLQTTRGISQFRGQWLQWRGHKLHGDVSSCVFAAKSQRQGRSLERPAKGHGGTRAASSQEKKIVESEDGNPSRAGDRAVLGERGPFCAICHPQARHIPHHAIYAVMRLLAAHTGHAATWRVGTSGGWLGLADLGLGHLAGCLNTVSTLALYRSFEIGKMSIVAPLSASYPVLTLLLSVLTGERLTMMRLAGIILTIVGVVLVAGERRFPAMRMCWRKNSSREKEYGRGLGVACCRRIRRDVLVAWYSRGAGSRCGAYGLDHSCDKCLLNLPCDLVRSPVHSPAFEKGHSLDLRGGPTRY